MKSNFFCHIKMPFWRYWNIRIKPITKTDKASYIIYSDLECIIEKIDRCKNNPENSSTAKVSEHIPSGFPMPTISSFRGMEIKHDVYRNKDCINKFLKYKYHKVRDHCH